MTQETYISPRQQGVNERTYLHKRFEAWMKLEDNGTLTREQAIETLRDELGQVALSILEVK